jgi:uncharacterized protein with HEPN domain
LKKKDIIYILHIRDAIDLILEYTKDINMKDFKSNQIIQDAVIRRIAIIGEAIKNVSMNFRKKYSEIAWKKIAGMRDKVIHGYFNVDVDRVWIVIIKDIPVLKKRIEEIINKEVGNKKD